MSLENQLRKILDDACESGEECGLQLTIFRHGEKIVELAAGWEDASRAKKVTVDSLFPIFSCGKPVAATAAHLLAEKRKLSYDMLLGDVWPEFRTGGRERIRLWHVLNHRAGMAAMPKVTLDDWGNWDLMCRELAKMSPKPLPGTRCTYHGITYAWLLGETINRVTGENFRDIIVRDLLTPLGIQNDFFYGINESLEKRAVRLDDSGLKERSSVKEDIDNPHVRYGFIPSANAHATATALATHYAGLLGEGPFQPVLRKDTLENATILRRDPDDPITCWARFGLGYALIDHAPDYGNIFGQGGAAGSEGFAVKREGLAVALTKNKLNYTHPVHYVRDRISEVLGLPIRHW